MENIFIGEYTHSIDDKGRVAVPKKFRAKLAEGGVLTVGLDGCLFLFPSADWNKFVEESVVSSIKRASGRSFERLMLGKAAEIELDKQGRVNVPNHLREYASIKKSVVVAGLGKRIELWAEDKWKAFISTAAGDSTKIAEELGGLGV